MVYIKFLFLFYNLFIAKKNLTISTFCTNDATQQLWQCQIISGFLFWLASCVYPTIQLPINDGTCNNMHVVSVRCDHKLHYGLYNLCKIQSSKPTEVYSLLEY